MSSSETEQIESLFAKLAERVFDARRLPEATYRLQFHAGFTFRDAAKIANYLNDLGITHCYASPYLRARPGSTHGYDIVDHRMLNPEIGTEEDYHAWVATLRDHELGQILDMVPNHMGVVGNENPWWNDVLENGPSSPYGTYFDISWNASPRQELQNRVLIPTLGDPYGRVLESGQLQLRFEHGAFCVYYHEHRFPVDPRSYELILAHNIESLEAELAADDADLMEYRSILTSVSHLPCCNEVDPERVAERQREKEVVKRRLGDLAERSPAVRGWIEKLVTTFNGTPGDRHSFDLLDMLLDRQPYRLSLWRVASDEINYRRFFDINDLAALSMEREEVFAATHELVLKLLQDESLDGLRIDHPDGLYDPEQYFERLQDHFLMNLAREIYLAGDDATDEGWEALAGPLRTQLQQAAHDPQNELLRRPLYVSVEKILGANESLPETWRVHGTSGYDFLNMVNGLFVDTRNSLAFTRLYQEWIQDTVSFSEIIYQKKLLILRVALASELHMLAHQLDRLAQKCRSSRDWTLNSLRQALQEVIACFPVYRSYISDEGVGEADRRYVNIAVQRAISRNPTVPKALFRFIRDMLLLEYPETATEDDKAEQRRFAGKFQQVTAPVTAKGIEDTAFYVYQRLISLNEVGGEPSQFGISPDRLHRYHQDRQEKWPYGLSPLATHDTKRSGDVRARINVLSELPDEWRERVARWSRLNEAQKIAVDELLVPDANEEYFLYQTLLGAWPLEDLASAPDFVQRIQDYVVKALHEAKVHSSWINPNDEYDQAAQQFVARILDENLSADFLRDFREFQSRVSQFGMFNSLSQTLLKITCPGVPDTYQGTEIWDFSLVDPDNRRPVDYERRRELLDQLKQRVEGDKDLVGLARELLEHKEDGRIKLYVTWRGLTCRRQRPGLFSAGAYLPGRTVGNLQDHLFAFAREQAGQLAVVVVPCLLARRLGNGERPLGAGVWDDTQVVVPITGPLRRMRNVFTGECVEPRPENGHWAFSASAMLADFPVALLVAE